MTPFSGNNKQQQQQVEAEPSVCKRGTQSVGNETCPKANRQKDNQQQFSIITPRSKPSKSKPEWGEWAAGAGEREQHKDVCQRRSQRGREEEGETATATATQVCISKKIIIIDAAKEAQPEEARERERERERWRGSEVDFRRLED